MPMNEKKYLSDYPDILKEFAYDLNKEKPEELTKGSDHIVHWRCLTCNGVYTNSPYHKIKDQSGCPYCKNKKVLPGFNDLATKRPDLLKYWGKEKNDAENIYSDKVMYVANIYAWWICGEGHLTNQKISYVQKSKQFNCLECAKIRSELKKLQSKKKEERKFQRERDISEKKEEQANKRPKIQTTSYDSLNNDIKMLWDEDENVKRGLKIEKINYGRLYNWKCCNGHKWKADLLSIKTNQECPICYARENSIAKLYPYLKDVYDQEKNDNIPVDMKLAVDVEYLWWKCNKGHSFISTLYSEKKHVKTGCMYCDREKSFYSTIGWIGKQS